LYYIGLDVCDYNQSVQPKTVADEYVVSSSSGFVAAIGRYQGSMDAVISCHNLEHCEDPNAVLRAMAGALKPGGYLYLSFPSEASVSFPSRRGCLNFFDDDTHRAVPSWHGTLATLGDCGLSFVFVAERYRPFSLWLKGLLLEPVSAVRRQVLGAGATWALYGFESVIWAMSPEGPVVVHDWGEKGTLCGVPVNEQPDGSAALWIRASNVNRFGAVTVRFGRYVEAASFGNDPGMLTVRVPQAIIESRGRHEVELREASGRATRVGVFLTS
jgi:hypothetical protein